MYVVDRDEVSRAVAKMDVRTIESSIVAIRKRLDKHFMGFAEVSVRGGGYID